MSSYGMTPYTQAQIANAISGISAFSVPILAVQLHLGAPGPSGLLLPSTVNQRQLSAFNPVSGVVTQTGGSPTWFPMPTTENIVAVSFWDNLTFGAGNCIWTAGLVNPELVAGGDTYILNSSGIAITYGLAS